MAKSHTSANPPRVEDAVEGHGLRAPRSTPGAGGFLGGNAVSPSRFDTVSVRIRNTQRCKRRPASRLPGPTCWPLRTARRLASFDGAGADFTAGPRSVVTVSWPLTPARRSQGMSRLKKQPGC
jgi:hypothetical protein